VWKPLRALRVTALRRAQVEDFINRRAAEHPRSALDELQFLKRVLRDAKGRGQRIDEAVLEMRAVKHAPRRGKALSVDELYSWRRGSLKNFASNLARRPGGSTAEFLVQPH
jgi:hypothetical protein